MDEVNPIKIQVLTIVVSISYLIYISRLIVKGKLRAEYSIVWIICTLVLVVFSFWKKGLEVLSHLIGVYEPPNLVFTGAIFAIMVYLLHLSVVVSKLQEQNKALAQEIALLRKKME